MSQLRGNNERHAHYAVMEALAVVVLLYIGSYWIALGWAGLLMADLLVFEWSENPEKYGWFGENPYLAGSIIGMLSALYFVVLLISMLL